MRRERRAAIELANVRGQIRGCVRHSPHKPGDDEGEIDEPHAAMNVDPERSRFLWNVVEQETERSEKNDQRGDDPVKRDGGRTIARKRRDDMPWGRKTIHALRSWLYSADSLSDPPVPAIAARRFCGSLAPQLLDPLSDQSI